MSSHGANPRRGGEEGAMLKAVIIPVTPYQQNCSLIWCEATKQAAAIDPGGELDRIDEQLTAYDLRLEKILITHGHIDHAGATDAFQERHGVPIEGPQREDQFWIDQLVEDHYRQIVPEARPPHQPAGLRTATRSPSANSPSTCATAPATPPVM